MTRFELPDGTSIVVDMDAGGMIVVNRVRIVQADGSSSYHVIAEPPLLEVTLAETPLPRYLWRVKLI